MSATAESIDISVEPEFGSAIAAQWDRLADALDAPPHLRPGWFAAWHEVFGTGTLELFVARRSDRVTGVLPLERRLGALRGLANYHSPGFGALAEGGGALSALTDAAISATRRSLSLPLSDLDGQLERAARAAAERSRFRVLSRTMQRTPTVAVDGSWDSYLQQRSRAFRKELRRHRRRLEEMGAIEIESTRGRDRLADLLEEVFVVEASGWKGERGTAIASRAETRRFYTDIAEWASERGTLRLLILRLDGKPIAVDYALEDGGVRYMLKGGFDPQYSRAAPGTLLMEAGLQDAFECGLNRVELGGGDDEYKLRWTGELRARSLVQAFAPNPLGAVEWAGFAWVRPAAKRVLRRRNSQLTTV